MSCIRLCLLMGVARCHCHCKIQLRLISMTSIMFKSTIIIVKSIKKMRNSSSVKTIKVSFDAIICISAGGDTCRQISRRIFRVLCIAQKLKGVMSGGYDIIRRKVVHSKNRNSIYYHLKIGRFTRFTIHSIGNRAGPMALNSSCLSATKETTHYCKNLR